METPEKTKFVVPLVVTFYSSGEVDKEKLLPFILQEVKSSLATSFGKTTHSYGWYVLAEIPESVTLTEIDDNTTT